MLTVGIRFVVHRLIAGPTLGWGGELASWSESKRSGSVVECFVLGGDKVDVCSSQGLVRRRRVGPAFASRRRLGSTFNVHAAIDRSIIGLSILAAETSRCPEHTVAQCLYALVHHVFVIIDVDENPGPAIREGLLHRSLQIKAVLRILSILEVEGTSRLVG